MYNICIYIYVCVCCEFYHLLATWWFRMCWNVFHHVPSVWEEVWGWHHSAQVAMIHEIKSEGMQPRVSTNREFQDTLSLQGPVQGSLLDIFRLLILSWYWHVNPWGPVVRIFAIKNEVRVVGLPQCGMFMDQPDYTGKPSYTPLYANIFNLMGAWVWNWGWLP